MRRPGKVLRERGWYICWGSNDGMGSRCVEEQTGDWTGGKTRVTPGQEGVAGSGMTSELMPGSDHTISAR